MQSAALWTALFFGIGVQAQAPIPRLSNEPDFSPGPLRKIEGLNSAQEKTVADYILRTERRNGDLRVLVDRNQIVLRSSEALHRLFPDDRFVAVTSLYQATSQAQKKYGIPGPLTYTLALDKNGNDAMANRTEYLAEYGALLHSRGIKVDDATSAALVRRALEEIYGFALGGEDVRRSKSQWYLGYNQHPWRATSSYEEIREASYYVLITNTEGLVTKGRLVNEVLERRKVAMPTPPAPSTTSLTDRALWKTEVGLGNSEVGILTHRHIRLEIRSQFAVRVRSGSHEISRSGCSSRISRWRRLTRRVRLGRKAVRTQREPDHLHLTRSFLRVVGASASRSEVEPKADSQVAHFNARLRGTAREGVVAPNSAIVDLSAV